MEQNLCAACGKPIGAIIEFDKTCSPECGAEIIEQLKRIKPPYPMEQGNEISLKHFYINLAVAKLKMESDPEYADRILNPKLLR